MFDHPFPQMIIDEFDAALAAGTGSHTAISFLAKKHPETDESEIRRWLKEVGKI